MESTNTKYTELDNTEIIDLQNDKLDALGDELGHIKKLASTMNNKIDDQMPIIDGLTTKVDHTGQQLRTKNVTLRDILHKERSCNNLIFYVIIFLQLVGIVVIFATWTL